MKRFLPLVLLVIVACNRETPGRPAATPAANAAAEAGRQMASRYGCGVCHVIPGIESARGQLGPSLAGVASRPKISLGTVDNTPENLVAFIRDPASKNPQSSMPAMAINDDEAWAIVAFLETLK